MAALLLSTCFLVLTTNGNFISQSQLNWNISSRYCNSHCSSQLASITSQNDMLFTTKTINDSLSQTYYANLDIWIGLNNLNDNTQFTWIDETQLNYTNWANNNPPPNITNLCVELNTDTNFNWTTSNCNEQKRSLCNHCDSKLTKYIAINTVYTNFSEAEDYCVDTLNTHLASIYSSRDMFEAQEICKLSTLNTGQSCWIGLINHSYADYNFTWMDNAALQFGETFNTFPWKEDEPTDWGNEKCVKLYEPTEYLWNNVPCDQHNYFLCNLPSEICSQNAIWNTLYSEFVFRCGDVFFDRTTINGNYFSLIENKQWDNHGNELLIEFRFAIHHFQPYDIGTMGIMLFNLESICEYFYIAISCNDNDFKCNLFIRKYINDEPIMLARMEYERYLQYESDPNKPHKFNTLLIKVTGNKIETVLNDNWSIAADINGMVKINTTLSGYIGIRGEHSMFTTKSLYVSGTEIIRNNVIDYSQCNRTYKVVPLPNITAEPTYVPTESPVAQPTYDITYGVTISITFIYTSDMNITLLLKNITQTIINNEIIDIDNNCVLSNDYNINIHQKIIDDNRTQTIINATIFVCDEIVETQLSTDFENNLEYDFINKIPEHLVVITDINIDVDIIDNVDNIIYTTQAIYNTNNNDLNHSNKSDSTAIIVCIVIIILIVIVLLLWVYVKRVKRLKLINSNKVAIKQNIEMTDNNTAGFTAGFTADISPASFIVDDNGDEMYETVNTPNGETVNSDLNMPDMDEDEEDINDMFTQSPTQQTMTGGTKVPQIYTGDEESDEEIYKDTQCMKGNAKSFTVEGD